MATKNKQQPVSPEEAEKASAALRAILDGFGGEELIDHEITAWFDAQVFPYLIGEVLDIKWVPDQFNSDGDLRPIAIIKVNHALKALDQGDVGEYPAGTNIGFGIKHKSMILLNAVGYEVAILPGERKNIGKGRTLQLYNLRFKKDGKPAMPSKHVKIDAIHLNGIPEDSE